jgi:hypothetical protein
MDQARTGVTVAPITVVENAERDVEIAKRKAADMAIIHDWAKDIIAGVNVSVSAANVQVNEAKMELVTAYDTFTRGGGTLEGMRQADAARLVIWAETLAIMAQPPSLPSLPPFWQYQ